MSAMWVRLDTSITHHDKTLRLLQLDGGWQAFGVYVLGLAWSGGQGTDGHIPSYALSALHATEAVAAMLVDVAMWEPAPDGWIIRNWDKRQDTHAQIEGRRLTAHVAGLKGACRRYHQPGCECWKPVTSVNGVPHRGDL